MIQNVSHSIGFGFGAAFVDYDHGMLWVSATPNERGANKTAKRPFGPPHKFCGHWECGVYVFNSTDLLTWERSLADGITWSGPNTDIGRVYGPGEQEQQRRRQKQLPRDGGEQQRPAAANLPGNLPPHRYVMATESGDAWIVNNNENGDLRSGWVTLPPSQAKGGVEACPSVRYLPSDGYYYTGSGGRKIVLQRSKDLLHWEQANRTFVEPSQNDTRVASEFMQSAAQNLENGNASLSFPYRSKWDIASNDVDFCCESWGGAAPNKGGPNRAFVVWGCDGQGSSGWKKGPEGFACSGETAEGVTLEKLL